MHFMCNSIDTIKYICKFFDATLCMKNTLAKFIALYMMKNTNFTKSRNEEPLGFRRAPEG